MVLGALSPRTRNAQVELYQSGDVDYLVATDAIGMGLNLDVDHVAFASDKKFDGFRFRKLYPAELGQIAGRAGRHMRDGTFGTTARCPPFDARDGGGAGKPHLRSRSRAAMAQPGSRLFVPRRACATASLTSPASMVSCAAPMGEDVAALEILAREDDIQRFRPHESARSSGCGRSARCPTTARFRRRPMPISSARSTASS